MAEELSKLADKLLVEVWQWYDEKTKTWNIIWGNPIGFSSKFGRPVRLSHVWLSIEEKFQYEYIQNLIKISKLS